MFLAIVCYDTVAYRSLLGNDPKQTTRQHPLLGSGPRATVEVLLEAVFSIYPLRGCMNRPTEFSSVSECNATERRGVKRAG
jgi:hypothetical protein